MYDKIFMISLLWLIINNWEYDILFPSLFVLNQPQFKENNVLNQPQFKENNITCGHP